MLTRILARFWHRHPKVAGYRPINRVGWVDNDHATSCCDEEN